jgi:hypothetical protein
MSDEVRLLAVIVIIYLADCLYWIPRNGIALTKSFGLWRVRWPSLIFGNDRGAIALANPLPPFGLAARALPSPVSFGPEGVLSYAAPMLAQSDRLRQATKFFLWTEIKSVERDEAKLLINGDLFHHAASGYSARNIGNQIVRIWRTAPGERAKAISTEVAHLLNPDDARKRWKEFGRATREIEIFTHILFCVLFFIIPLLVWQFGLSRVIWPVLSALLLQTIVLALLFRRAHQKLYPENGSEILKPFLTMVLAPPAAIRAKDFLSRPLFENFHPLAVAGAFCPRGDFEKTASLCVRNLTYSATPPLQADFPVDALETERWFRDESRAHLIEVVEKAGFSCDQLLAAPDKSDPSHTAYCPRCLQQFASAATCPDCAGFTLSNF